MEAETIESHQPSKAQKHHTGTDHHGSTSLDMLGGACGAVDILTGVGSNNNHMMIAVKAVMILNYVHDLMAGC